MAWPCPFSVKFSTPIPVQAVVQNDIMALPENPLGATSVVPGVKPVEGMLLPTPIRCVLGGKFHVEGMTMVPAGSKMFDGGGFVIPAHGLAVQVMLNPAT